MSGEGASGPETPPSTGGGTGPAPGPRRLNTFASLRHRDFRFLWLGQVGNGASLWMEQVARPLLILSLTGSALQVGNIIAARMAPQLILGLVAGAAADRYDKRVVLMFAQGTALLMHLTIGLLVLSDRVEVWHVYATAIGSGTANAFLGPARQSLLPRLVPRHDLLNAVALNAAAMNTMRILGASLAGLLLIWFDFGEVYLVNAGIFLAVIWTTTRIRDPGPIVDDRTAPDSDRRGASLASDVVEGLRYLRQNRDGMSLIGTALILFIFGGPYQQVFIPLIAIEVLHQGRSMVGVMLAATGAGAILGSVTMATKGRIPRRGVVMLSALTVFALALVLFAQSDWLWLSFIALLVTGTTQTTYFALNNSLLLELTRPGYHGRVMSFMSLDRGFVSAGAVMAGALAHWLGPRTGLTVMGTACGVLAVAALFLVPRMRRLD